MEMNTAKRLLDKIARWHEGKLSTEDALKNLALALMHLANGIEEIQRKQEEILLLIDKTLPRAASGSSKKGRS
jgi:hypothetical protein